MQSTLFLFGRLPHTDVREIVFTHTTALSLTGPAKLVALLLRVGLESGTVTPEQIAQFGIHREGKRVHLLFLDRPATLDRLEAAEVNLEHYHYAHFVSAMDHGVNVALFDYGFCPDLLTGKALGAFCSAIFKNGRIRGSDTNTLLLLGTSNRNRVLVASQYGGQHPLRTIHQKLKDDTRLSICKSSTILCAGYKTSDVAALHVLDLLDVMETGGSPEWRTTTVPGVAIEEISLSVGSSPTVILTSMLEGERQLLPANLLWQDHRRQVSLVLARHWATDLDAKSAPLVRVNPVTQCVCAVDGTGGYTRLFFDTFEGYNPRPDFARLVADAASGSIAAATM